MLCIGGWQDGLLRFQSWNLNSPVALQGYSSGGSFINNVVILFKLCENCMITPTFLDVPLGYVFTILIAFLTPVHLQSSDTCMLTHSTHIVTWFSTLFKLWYLSTKDKGGWGGSSAGHRGRTDHMRQTARAVQLLPQNSNTHILTHTCCCLGWHDMHVARPDTKRGESSVASVMITGWCGDRQAPAATPDHVSEAEFLSDNQSQIQCIHFLSLSHTLVQRIVMGQHRPFIMPLCVFTAVTSDGHVQPFLRSDPMF